MYYVPEEHEDAELLAERIAIRLQHSNSAVVLTTVKVILYLMNYMGSEDVVDAMCRKLSPPLGAFAVCSCSVLLRLADLFLSYLSHSTLIRVRSSIRRSPQHSLDHPKTTSRPSQRRQGLLRQVQRSHLRQTGQARDHLPISEREECGTSSG